ncbi:MAG: hypothetical protein IRY87_04365 [Acetobacteraceae bacterium]|nr:hypothetical protein [Acetobacteraceae bacterium]
MLDPDNAVRNMLEWIFERFAVLCNERALQHDFAEHRLRMPCLVQQGPEVGHIFWSGPTYQMIQQVLTSLVYAGVLVYADKSR